MLTSARLFLTIKTMSFKYSQEINDDYEKLFESEKDYDVIIYAGEDKNVKEIHAHSLILSTRSQYFRGAFSNEWIKKENGNFIFKKPNISPQLFKIILRFIYCGKVDLSVLQVPDILKLLMAVDELNIQTLISCIQKYLTEDQEQFLQQNLLEILQMVYRHEPFTDLRNYCLKNIKILFNSDRFINLETPLLEFLLKDDLNLDEIEIWESLIKWGLSKDKTLNQDVSNWNEDNFNSFKKILCKFIPLIRFYGISSEDYFNKVKPYEEILSKELQDEILKFHMVPGYKSTYNLLPRHFVGSVLVNQRHISLFTNWIDRKDENTKYNIIPYKFNLLYRASRDGNTAATFHDKCDNKGATIVIAKIANSEQILGGYNPLYWNSNSGWMFVNGSFIFSFANKNNFKTAKVGYTRDSLSNIYCNEAYGPTFGLGHDLSFQYNNTTNSVSYNTRYYPRIDILTSHKIDGYGDYKVFNVEDYEVFQVIKK